MYYLYTKMIIKYPSFFKKILGIFLLLRKFYRNKKIRKKFDFFIYYLFYIRQKVWGNPRLSTRLQFLQILRSSDTILLSTSYQLRSQNIRARTSFSKMIKLYLG